MRTNFRIPSLALGVVLLAGLGACATQPAGTANSYPANAPTAQTNPNYVEYGRVSAVEAVRTQEQGRGTGMGVILGGIAGAVAGNQVGKGGGQDAATVIGAVGGAAAGHAIEKNARSETRETYRVSIQLDNGGSRAYEVVSSGDLRVGDRVRIQNNQIYRM